MFADSEREQDQTIQAQELFEPDWGGAAEDRNPVTNMGAAPGTSCSGSRASRSSTPRSLSIKRPARCSGRGTRSKSPRTDDRGELHAEVQVNSEAEESEDPESSDDESRGGEAGEARNHHQWTRSGQPMVGEEPWTAGPGDGEPRNPYENPSSSAPLREVCCEKLRGDGWRDGVTTNVMPEFAPMGSDCSEDGHRPSGPTRGEVERGEGFGGATVDSFVNDGGMSEPIRLGLISQSRIPPQVEDAFDDEDDKGTHPPARRGALNQEAAYIND